MACFALKRRRRLGLHCASSATCSRDSHMSDRDYYYFWSGDQAFYSYEVNFKWASDCHGVVHVWPKLIEEVLNFIGVLRVVLPRYTVRVFPIFTLVVRLSLVIPLLELSRNGTVCPRRDLLYSEPRASCSFCMLHVHICFSLSHWWSRSSPAVLSLGKFAAVVCPNRASCMLHCQARWFSIPITCLVLRFTDHNALQSNAFFVCWWSLLWWMLGPPHPSHVHSASW